MSFRLHGPRGRAGHRPARAGDRRSGGGRLGEIFARPRPVVGLPFTGERLTSELGGQTEIEHLHRYLLARHLARGRDVLDIASGEGYGAALLAQTAASVVGVEVAEEAVAHAARHYAGTGLRFLQGDARRIPLEDGAVDLAVSFETIEHFEGQAAFLAELRRVLRPGGLALISTPDRDNYSPAEAPANPYHALELTQAEFAALLGRHFAHVAMWWQRPLIGSALMPGPEATPTAETLCFERRGDTHFEGSLGYARPRYLVALCSDAPLPALPASIYVHTGQLDAAEQHLRGVIRAEQARVQALEAALHEAQARAAAAEARAAAAEARAVAAEGAAAGAAGAAAAALQAQAEATDALAAREAQLAAVFASSSWRLTGPLRAVRRLLGRPGG